MPLFNYRCRIHRHQKSRVDLSIWSARTCDTPAIPDRPLSAPQGTRLCDSGGIAGHMRSSLAEKAYYQHHRHTGLPVEPGLLQSDRSLSCHLPQKRRGILPSRFRSGTAPDKKALTRPSHIQAYPHKMVYRILCGYFMQRGDRYV